MSFRFKQFSIDDDNCPMKVGTDSVLLGAWADLPETGHILDVGTGSGLLALMAAQRSMAQITGIDIHAHSIDKAKQNFFNSHWSSRLDAILISLQDFAGITPYIFDHIISNPPYFVNSLKAPDKSRSKARHNDDLPFRDLAAASSKLLRPNGKLSLILPPPEAEVFQLAAKDENLSLSRQLKISPFANKPANRIVMEFSPSKSDKTFTETLFIRNQQSYSEAYMKLTREFYLNF